MFVCASCCQLIQLMRSHTLKLKQRFLTRSHPSFAFVMYCVIGLTLGIPEPVDAEVLYVNNRLGENRFDGVSQRPNGDSGPVRTISKALKLANLGDTIIIANTGEPYYESLMLNGQRHSGTKTVPFKIVGNGAIIDGSQKVPPKSWRSVSQTQLWKFKPKRKGNYLLLLEDKPVPTEMPPTGEVSLKKLQPFQWTAKDGEIYYHPGNGDTPDFLPFRFAAHGVGISLHKVERVEISNLVVRWFRADGVHLHRFCSNVNLDGIAVIENGRHGIFVGNHTELLAKSCLIAKNQQHSIFLEKEGKLRLEECEIDQPPNVEEEKSE